MNRTTMLWLQVQKWTYRAVGRRAPWDYVCPCCVRQTKKKVKVELTIAEVIALGDLIEITSNDSTTIMAAEPWEDEAYLDKDSPLYELGGSSGWWNAVGEVQNELTHVLNRYIKKQEKQWT
jgi:hypothetical protein